MSRHLSLLGAIVIVGQSVVQGEQRNCFPQPITTPRPKFFIYIYIYISLFFFLPQALLRHNLPLTASRIQPQNQVPLYIMPTRMNLRTTTTSDSATPATRVLFNGKTPTFLPQHSPCGSRTSKTRELFEGMIPIFSSHQNRQQLKEARHQSFIQRDHPGFPPPTTAEAHAIRPCHQNRSNIAEIPNSSSW